jgi:AraC family transcriptional activator of mtrCDE
MTQLVSPGSDAVSEVLRTFAVRSTIFCRSELRAPWAFRVEGESVAKFHLVLEGSAHLRSGSEEVTLVAGDLVILPRGAEHTLADDPRSQAAPLQQLLAEHGVDGGSRLRYGGGGSLTRLLCGGFSLAEGITDATLALFPDVLHTAYDPGAAPWLEPVLAALTAEAEDGQPGASAIVAKITDVFLAQALRTWLLEEELEGTVLPARMILDDSIAKAVHTLNNRPSEPWSLDRLASHVGLSRTALSTKFRQRVGQPPMRYLTELRLRRAAEELAAGRPTLREVAHRAGYDSDAAFAKAFKRRFGLSPGTYSRIAKEPPRVEVAALR